MTKHFSEPISRQESSYWLHLSEACGTGFSPEISCHAGLKSTLLMGGGGGSLLITLTALSKADSRLAQGLHLYEMLSILQMPGVWGILLRKKRNQELRKGCGGPWTHSI